MKVPQFVVTHEGQNPVTRDGLTFTFVTDGLQRAIELAKAVAGDNNVSILGGIVNLIKMVEIITGKNLESGASSLFSRSYIPL